MGHDRFPLSTVLVALSALAGAGASGGDGRIVRMTDFGAEPDSRRNAVTAVSRALQACRRAASPVLVFPKGRYDFWPQHAVERETWAARIAELR